MGNCLPFFGETAEIKNQCHCHEDFEDSVHLETVVRHELQNIDQKEENTRLRMEGKRLSQVERKQYDLKLKQREEGRRLGIKHREMEIMKRIQKDKMMELESEQQRFKMQNEELENDKRRMEKDRRKDMEMFEMEKKCLREEHERWMQKEKDFQKKDRKKMKQKKENQQMKRKYYTTPC